MHTRISTLDFGFWLFILLSQFSVCIASRSKSPRPLYHYLAAETVMGVTLATAAKTIEAWSYFHFWIVCMIAHELFCAYLLGAMLNRVRRLGLPSRQSVLPIQIAVGAALGLGIYTSSFALTALSSRPVWQICLSWDHAFWWAMCCMFAFLPLYAFTLSASIPRTTLLILIGLGIYCVAEARILEHVISHRGSGWWSRIANVVYCISLSLWYAASRSNETSRVKHDVDNPELLIATSVARENQP